MTPDWRPDRTKPKCPPDRSGDAVAATASNLCPDASELGQDTQIQGIAVTQRPDLRGEWPQTAARDAQTPLRQRIREHSLPITRPAEGAG